MSEHTATGEFRPRSWEGSPDKPTLTGYEILEELGRGGMGVVYKARQLSANRLVALKLIRDGALASDSDRQRFRIEAEASARMAHPYIVQIYEAGEDHGRPFLAMELIEGGSLDHQLHGQPVAPHAAASLIRLLALAVDHAHLQQIVHRDLKPANILMDAQSALPKITDFGLAKRLDRESTAVTRDGTVLGTAAYMAPEQAAGRVHDIRPAVDIYALGAILYELLTGQPPFVGESWNQTVDMVLNDPPVPPSRHNAAVPRDLETICLKCLEKDAEQRYATANELANDLDRYLNQQPITAQRITQHEFLSRHAKRAGYQLFEEIGRGPASKVYHAQLGSQQQHVAIKVFCGTINRATWNERLEHSSASWSVLHHPQLVLCQQSGWWDSMPFVVSEFCPLGSLAGKLTGRPWPIRQAIELVAKLAEVVSYLHRQGVIHGNIKPSNVMLAAGDIPRLIDFLPLTSLDPGQLKDNDVPPAGVASLAPELLNDPTREPGMYTDLYGLGVVLYQLLTGQPPFTGTTVAELRNHILQGDPVLPTHLNPKVPPFLESLCLRCLSRKTSQRYYRAYDVSTRLQSMLQDHK